MEAISMFGPGHTAKNPEALQMDEAFALLVSRRLRGLKLGYPHEGKTWREALMSLWGGLRAFEELEFLQIA